MVLLTVIHGCQGDAGMIRVPSSEQVADTLQWSDSISTDYLIRIATEGSDLAYHEAFDPLFITLPDSDFQALTTALSDTDAAFLGYWLPLHVAQRIFPFPLDTSFIEDGQIQIDSISLSSNGSFRHFAVVIGTGYAADHNDLYFFNGTRMLGAVHNYHRYGLDHGHFKRPDGTAVFHLVQCLASGTGIWQFNRYFFQITDDSMYPVLNVMERSNLHGWQSPRYLWYLSELRGTDPLTYRYVHHTTLVDTGNQEVALAADSGYLRFHWDPIGQAYAPLFGMGLRRMEHISYHLDAPHALTVAAFKQPLVGLMASGDSVKSGAAWRLIMEAH